MRQKIKNRVPRPAIGAVWGVAGRDSIRRHNKPLFRNGNEKVKNLRIRNKTRNATLFRRQVAARQTALFQVLLVVVFSAIKLRSRSDLSHDGAQPFPRGLKPILRSARGFFLFGGVKKDGTAILRAPIRPLTVLRGGIVVLPEDVKQRFIRNLRRVELHFHHFRMACRVSANIFVSRVLGLAAGVTNGGCSHSWHSSESGLYTPKASRTERRLFNLVFHINLDVFQRASIQMKAWLRRPSRVWPAWNALIQSQNQPATLGRRGTWYAIPTPYDTAPSVSSPA